MRNTKLLSILVVSALLASCASWSGSSNIGTASVVNFDGPGHKIVDRVSATVDCGYILGMIPLSDVELYKLAMEEVRAEANLVGKPLALAHVTTDLVVTDYIVYTNRSLTISADVVEFTK